MMQVVGLSFHADWICMCGQDVPAEVMHECANPQPCWMGPLCYLQLPDGDWIQVS